jgi:selenocysteine lyase/cysteine desulfurase
MGPHGTAFLYVNPGILSKLKPSIIGWHGISDSVIARAQSGQEPFQRQFNLNGVEPAKNATKFEWGTWSVITVAGARAAIEYTLSHPPEERFPRIEKLTGRLLDGVRRKLKKVTSPEGKERRSGIVTFEVEGAQALARKLQQEGVVVAPRVNTLRVSPHFYNTEEEIDKLLERIP